jgi:hypothetical protein
MGIDTVFPVRTHQTEGRGTDRADCMRKFKEAWARFDGDEANLTMFLAEKGASRRDPMIIELKGGMRPPRGRNAVLHYAVLTESETGRGG